MHYPYPFWKLVTLKTIPHLGEACRTTTETNAVAVVPPNEG